MTATTAGMVRKALKGRVTVAGHVTNQEIVRTLAKAVLDRKEAKATQKAIQAYLKKPAPSR